MAKDVVIIPASGSQSFRNNTIEKASIFIDNSDSLIISGSTISISSPNMVEIGAGGGDLYVGDGINPTNIIFEQNGSIKGVDSGGVTLTLGSPSTDLRLLGTPLAPTAVAGTNTFQIATTAFIANSISNLGLGALATLSSIDLTTGTSATTLIVSSSNGTNAILPAATTTVAGVLTGADKLKLTGIAAGATNVTNTNQLTNGAGYITGYTESDTLASVVSRGNTANSGIVIEGSVASGGTNFAGYRNGGDNLVLKGNASGVSGIFFQSEKDGVNINHPSDFGYIQYHAYGIDGTTGESNKLIIGVANDSTDTVVLQSPFINGVKISYLNATNGTGSTEATVWHADNLTNLNQLTNGPGYSTTTGTVTSVATTNGTGISVTGSPITTSGTLTITNTAPNVSTNLTTGTSATTLIVSSSDGTNAILPAATTTVAGVLTATTQGIAGVKTFTNGFIDEVTNIGKIATPYEVIATGSWALPIGSSRFIQPTSVGGTGEAGYWFTTGRRDVGGGYSGILTSYSNTNSYIGNATTSGSNPTWNKILTDSNFIAGTNYQTPLSNLAFTNVNNNFSVAQTFASSITANNAIFSNATAGITPLRVVGVSGSILIDNVGSGNNYFDAKTSQEFQIGGVNKFRIDSSGAATFASSVTATDGIFSGNVGIGVTNPISKLEVLTNFKIRNPSELNTRFNFGWTNSNSIAYLDAYNFSTGTRPSVAIQPDGGNLLIGTTADNGSKLQVAGAATFSSNVTATGGFRSSGDSFTQNAGGLFFNGVSSFGSGILSDTVGTALKLQSGGGVALLLGADKSATFASSVTTGGVLKVNNNSNNYQGTVIFGSASGRNYRITSGDDNGSMVFESTSLYGNSAYSFLGGTATFASSVTADGGQTVVLNGSNGSVTFGANQGGGGVIKYNSNGNLDIIPRSGYSTTFASSIVIAGDISGDGSATLKTYWGGAYGGGFQIKTDGATVDRYSRFGMISNSKQWVGGMIINNDTSATFTSSVTATAFFGPSDMRLKTLVEKVHTNSVANISEISYLWKDESMGKRIQVGYDASVVKEHMPNAVNTDAKGMLSVNYIQVLVAKVAALEEQVKKLQNGI
jgi:hypothetical protein